MSAFTHVCVCVGGVGGGGAKFWSTLMSVLEI